MGNGCRRMENMRQMGDTVMGWTQWDMATLNMGDGEEGRVGVDFNVLKLSGDKGLG